MPKAPDDLRLGELVATLALGQDGAFGQPLESQLRACLIATWLAESMELPASERTSVHWVAQLRYLGCTGHAHEAHLLFGDEIDARARSLAYDAANPLEVLYDIATHVGDDLGPLGRTRAVLAALAGGRAAAELNFRTGCEVADVLARRLSMAPSVCESLAHTFERWNGRGFPAGVEGKAIPRPMRIVHLAQDMEVLLRLRGADAARQAARKRSGGAYDPDLVEVYLGVAGDLEERLDGLDPWDAVLASEPDSHQRLRGSALDEALVVVADFADLKSPYTGGHSRGVAALARAAAEHLGLPPAEITAVQRAGWVHELGRLTVPNSIWDKPGPLTRAEIDRVQLHPVRTEQMLRRSPALAALTPIAASAHERLDGSGYSKGLTAPALPIPARVIAAADCYHAMTEDRAHRPALTGDAAAGEVRSIARRGLIDPDGAEAVLVAAGHRRRRRRQYPGGLTRREVEVLRLAAQGLTTRQIAQRLVITAKTADHHIQHIYAKIGVSTRGAAALFASEHDLVRPLGEASTPGEGGQPAKPYPSSPS